MAETIAFLSGLVLALLGYRFFVKLKTEAWNEAIRRHREDISRSVDSAKLDDLVRMSNDRNEQDSKPKP